MRQPCFLVCLTRVSDLFSGVSRVPRCVGLVFWCVQRIAVFPPCFLVCPEYRDVAALFLLCPPCFVMCEECFLVYIECRVVSPSFSGVCSVFSGVS